jgi:hypothetical protein
MQLFGRYNNPEFMHDLISGPTFATDAQMHITATEQCPMSFVFPFFSCSLCWTYSIEDRA